MLDICADIEEASICYANLAHKYAKAATFGNETDKLLCDLVRLYFYIDIMERNMPAMVYEKVLTPLQGGQVLFSSLTKQNNTLILKDQGYYCIQVECRPCLSDEEICSVIEKAKLMCSCI